MVSVSLGLASCDPAPALPAKGAADVPAPTATATAQAPVKEMDPALIAVTPLDAQVIGRVDFAALRAQNEWHGVIEALSPGNVLAEWSRRCGFDVLQAVDEGVVTWSKGAGMFVALKLHGLDDATVTKCAAAIGDGRSAVSVAGAPGAWVSEGVVLLAKRGVALIGSNSAVEAAAARMDSPPRDKAALLAKLPRGASMLLSVAVSDVEIGDAQVSGTFQVTPGKLAIDVGLKAASAAEAAELERAASQRILGTATALLQETKAAATKGGEPERLALVSVQRMLDSVSVGREGERVSIKIGMQGEPMEVISGFGSVTAIAIFGVRRYLASAKASEAKNTVGAIARALWAKMNDDIEAEKKKKGGKASKVRFPASTGLTPPVVPAGTKFVPAPDTWSQPTWKAIGFRVESPLYYAYEIEVARDGKSAIARARGDLDGDGVQSTFEIPMELSPEGELLVATQIKIENEFE